MPASVELVKIALKAYADGYSEIALALCDPLIRWDERGSRSDGDLVWKREDVERAMRRYLDGWREYSFDLEDVAEVRPGRVVGICRERGIDADGAPVDRRFGGLWIVEGAKITSWSTYLTPKEAVRAAKQRGEEEAPSSGSGHADPPKAGARRDGRRPQAAKPTAPAGSAAAKRRITDEQKRRAAKARARLQHQKAAS